MELEENDNYGQVIFHGGCHGCTQQLFEGVDFCRGCQYFDADWSLPSLNNEEPSSADLIRIEIKRKHGLK
tara:strand:- start:2379 stop:2588 length:210 start_codon:yes stop_codon:yes gene_type:complete